MLLKIRLPDTVVVQGLLEQRQIPCLCRISESLFELLFQDPLPQAAGVVEGWSRQVIEDRAPAGVGGLYTHYCFGVVTLKRITQHIFEIVDLSFFIRTIGWCPIVEDGEICEARPLHTPEELDEIEAMFPVKKGNKKRQKLMEALAREESSRSKSE